MKLAIAFIVVALLMVGCQAAAAPNEAGLNVRVIAQPKRGVKDNFIHVGSYDVSPAGMPPTGVFEHVDYSTLDDIIVALHRTGARKETGDRGAPAMINMQIDPRYPRLDIVPARVGDTLLFENGTTQEISLYSASDGNEFNLGKLAPKAHASYVVKTEGQIELLTDPSKPPVRIFYATDGVRCVRLRSGETAKFDHLPPGSYRIEIWHPRLPGTTQDVQLSAGTIFKVSLAMGVNSLPPAP